MAHINLLPWREEQRKDRNTEFGVLAGIVLAIMLGVVGAVHLYFNASIEYQQQRNNLLIDQISLLDKKIKEIKDLESEKEKLLARMNVIQQLQASRPLIVHLFEELVTTLPEGVNLNNIKQENSGVTVQGIAQSNARVSSFMRNIEASEYLKEPGLNIIRANEQRGQRISEFTLKMKQASPGMTEEPEEVL